MYITVCDDTLEELNEISGLLSLWKDTHPEENIRYKVFQNPLEMLDSIKGSNRSDVYLLDIVMPGIDGISVADEIRVNDNAAEIVFLTSTPDFAYKSYSVRAKDYILKPVKKEKLFSVLDSIYYSRREQSDFFVLQKGASLIKIPFALIEYVEVIGKHVYFNLIDGTVHKVFGKMKDYRDRLLSRPEYMSPHRSYIVNMFRVASMSITGVVMLSKKSIPVSRLLYGQLREDYMNLLFEGKEVRSVDGN